MSQKNYIYLLIICNIFIVKNVLSSEFNNILSDSDTSIIHNNLYYKSIREVVDNPPRNLNKKCINHLQLVISNIGKKEGLWAMKMIDAASKLPSGILSGNVVDLGAFDQCLSIKEDVNKETIQGNYCKISMPLSILQSVLNLNAETEFGQPRGVVNLASLSPKITLAICLPAACDVNDLDILFSSTNITQMLELKAVNCQTNDPVPFDVGDYVVIVFLCFILFIIIASTTYEIYVKCHNIEPMHLILISFSVYNNGTKLFKLSNSANQLTCLNGIKFISMMWVIVGHTYYSAFYSPSINAVDIAQWYEKVSSMYILAATVSVDSFFLIGGLLLCYVYMAAMEKGAKFNLFAFYIHRYIRLTPVLAITVFIHMTIIKHMGTGPYWPEITKSLQTNCEKYWWSTLLYVHNYVNPREMCIGQTWYLAVDMQIFLISPIILISLRKWPKIILQALVLLVVISIIIPFVVAYSYEIPGLMNEAFSNLHFSEKYYYNTYVRFGPVIVGIIVGYFIHYRKQFSSFNKLFDNILFNMSGFIISIGILLTIVFAQNNMIKHDFDRVESAFFNGFHRVIWSIALAWIIYACVIGRGGIINKFLSMPIFQILSRLTYSMYLLHLSIQTMQIGRLRVPIHFSDGENMTRFWSDFMLTMFLSIIWTLAFESPIFILEKFIFQRNPKKSESKSKSPPV